MTATSVFPRQRRIDAPRLAFHISADGVTIKVNTVAKVSPKTMAVAICVHHWVEGAPTET